MKTDVYFIMPRGEGQRNPSYIVGANICEKIVVYVAGNQELLFQQACDKVEAYLLKCHVVHTM